MPSLATILLLWGLAAPLGTFVWVKGDAFFKQRAAVSVAVREGRAAVAATETRERQQCNVRVDSIAKEINDDAKKQIELARQASAAVVLAPADDAGLRILCNRSASCRERAAR